MFCGRCARCISQNEVFLYIFIFGSHFFAVLKILSCYYPGLTFDRVAVSPYLQPVRAEAGQDGLVNSGQVFGDLIPPKNFGTDEAADLAWGRLEGMKVLLGDVEVGRLSQVEWFRWWTLPWRCRIG